MLKKYIKLISIIVLILIIALIATFEVYANNYETLNFVSVKSNNITAGGTAEIMLDLSNIKYTSYNIQVSSDINIENVTATNQSTGANLPINNNAQQTVQNTTNTNTISSQSNTQTNVVQNITNNTATNTIVSNNNISEFTMSNLKNLNKISLFINMPNTLKEGDKIKINVTVTDVSSNNSVSGQVILNVVNQNENENQNESQKQSNNSQLQNNGNFDSLNKTMQNAGQSTTSVTTMTQSMISSSQQTVTYNGSDNNYLTNIYINNNTISNNFNKTSTTYFITEDSNTSSINISYDKDDSNSTVCIYGNENLKSGINKILLSVTAENGNVRYYRIYVTVK